jgi:hypothetical protein
MPSSIVEVTVGTAPTTPSSGLLDIFATASKQLSTIDDAGNVLSAPIIRENETLAVKPQQNSGSSATPTGNVSTTEKAMGLGLVSGFTITPQVTGRVMVFIAGMVLNSTAAGDGTNVTGRWGTGTAPSNGATSGLGTQFGAIQHFIASTTAGQQGFMVMGVVTGLTLNTAVWFDVSLLAVTGGGSTVKDVQIIVVEF